MATCLAPARPASCNEWRGRQEFAFAATAATALKTQLRGFGIDNP